MGILMLKAMFWFVVISATLCFFRSIGSGFIALVHWIGERRMYAEIERVERPKSEAKMREHYITQSIFLRVLCQTGSDHSDRMIAMSKEDGPDIHSRRVAEAMEQAKKTYTPDQIKALGL